MKSHVCLIMILNVLNLHFLNAQITFQKTFGSTSGDRGDQIISTSDGNYLIIGTYGATAGIYLLKIDSLGNSIWQKTLDPPNMLSFHYDYSIQETLDSGFIMVGTVYFTSGSVTDICLIKTNSTADTIWTKFYGGPNLGYYKAIGYDLTLTSDGGYAIVGTEIGTSSSSKNVFLIKTDSDGNIEWSKNYGGTYEDEGQSLKQTSDGGYIIAGYTGSFGQGGKDVYLLKVDSTGNLQWTRSFGGNRYDYANHIEITSDGGFILTGVTSGYGTGTIYDDDLFLMKMDSLGNSLWAYTYGGNSDEIGTSVKQTAEGGFIATGYTYSSGAGQADVYLLKTDSMGNVLWSKTFGGASFDYGYDVIQHRGNYLITGESRNFSKGYTDVYFIKADSLGNDTCKQDAAVTFKTSLPWVQGNGGTQNSGYTVKSHIIVVGSPDTSSYNPCVCVPPIAYYGASMTHSCGYFDSYSTWANSWYWDFGDGDTSTFETPGHCFPNGTFYVCLTVTNECGTDTYCDSIFASVGINELQKNKIRIFIAPNPFEYSTTIKFDNPKNEELKLLLLNPTGQSLMQIERIRNDNIQIERNGLTNGLYFVLIIKNEQIIGTEKLMIK